ncbi:MAG: hypothetical protein ACK4QL_03960 [Pseudanabaenaceae cyanobacterium]
MVEAELVTQERNDSFVEQMVSRLNRTLVDCLPKKL